MKNVCIIRSNPVTPDSRVEKEAWTLATAGYNVHILAWDRDSNHEAKDGFITVADKKIGITWLGFAAKYSAGMKSLKSYLLFQFHMRKWLKKHKNDYDIIHACDFDTAFFSQSVAKGKKFVFDVFDFLYGDPQTLFQKMVNKAQKRIINRADATIICTEERKRQIGGAKPKRLTVIHNTPIKYLQKGKTSLHFQSDSERTKVVYVGILARTRLLLEMGDVISQNKDVELHIAGFGMYESNFEELAEKHDNIFYYGRIPYDQTIELESKCDIMTAIYDPSVENNRFAAPNKFYESLMLGKPLLMVEGTGMSNVVAQNDIGEIIQFDKDSFRIGLQNLIDRRNEWGRMSSRMKELYDKQYNWSIMRERLASLYAELSK